MTTNEIEKLKLQGQSQAIREKISSILFEARSHITTDSLNVLKQFKIDLNHARVCLTDAEQLAEELHK